MPNKDKLSLRLDKDFLTPGDGVITMVDLPLRILFNVANFDGGNIIDVALGKAAKVLDAPGMLSANGRKPLDGHASAQAQAVPASPTRLGSLAPQVTLSARELEVLRNIARGLRNKEIAAELNIAEDTVKIHIKNIFSKLQVHDRTRAVVLASQMGMIQLEEIQ